MSTQIFVENNNMNKMDIMADISSLKIGHISSSLIEVGGSFQSAV